MKVAEMPWEKPMALPTVASAKREPESAASAAKARDASNYSNVKIKTEPGYENPYAYTPANGQFAARTSGLDGNLAHSRAQQLVAQRMASTTANANRLPHMSQAGTISQPRGQQSAHPSAQHYPNNLGPQALSRPQTDGTDDAYEDWAKLMAAMKAGGDDTRRAADGLMQARVDALAARLDSGLMVPLEPEPKSKRAKAAMRARQALAPACQTPSTAISCFDGPSNGETDVKEEPKVHDDDEINSDLDDSDDGVDDAGSNDDENTDIILCTYEKVQRVKNKWKCTLRDGMLSTSGKE